MKITNINYKILTNRDDLPSEGEDPMTPEAEWVLAEECRGLDEQHRVTRAIRRSTVTDGTAPFRVGDQGYRTRAQSAGFGPLQREGLPGPGHTGETHSVPWAL